MFDDLLKNKYKGLIIVYIVFFNILWFMVFGLMVLFEGLIVIIFIIFCFLMIMLFILLLYKENIFGNLIL